MPRKRRDSASNAKNSPAIIRPSVESPAVEVKHTGAREIDKEGELTKLGFEAVGSITTRKTEEEAFMNEVVTVLVHTTNEKQANPFPEVFVNGRVQRFVRGEEQKVRRCFVERLARAKATGYGNVKTKDVEGEDKYSYPPNTAPVYPFTVIGDSTKGRDWLKRILAEV